MKRKAVSFAIPSLTALLLFSACAKIASTDLGNDLIPAVDNVYTFETILDVESDNLLFDDTTRMIYGEPLALGRIDDDPVFGATEARIYASFVPSAYRSYPFLNRDTVLIDSVVLSLSYHSLFGDSNSVEQLQVYEIDPAAPFRDSLYMLNTPGFSVVPDPIGGKEVLFLTLNDSAHYRNGRDTIRVINELRIPLDTAWARRFVNYDTTDAYGSDTAFAASFRGLEIRATEASPSARALAYFNLSDQDRTRITFYCRIHRNGKTDTISPYFTYRSGPHANRVVRTPAHDFLANVQNGTPNDERIYLQAAPGSYATIRIPGLDTMSSKVVHRAELIMEKETVADDFYQVPDPLFIDVLSPTGDSAYTIHRDFVVINTSPGYDALSIGGQFRNNRYVFNLTRYVQGIITLGHPNRTLRVHAPFSTEPYYLLPSASQPVADQLYLLVSRPVAKGRVVVYGGAYPGEQRMRLRIIYSNL